MVDIAGLCHADNGVNQQVRLRHLCGLFGEFIMRPMQGIAGLKRANLLPTGTAELLAELVWAIATVAKIIVRYRFYPRYWSAPNRPNPPY